MADTANDKLAPQGDTLGRRAWRKLKASPLTLACFGIIGVYLLLAIFGFAGLTPDFQQKVGEKFLAPSLIKPSIWLGTDVFGRSVLYKLMAGARTAITLGVLVACISVPIGPGINSQQTSGDSLPARWKYSPGLVSTLTMRLDESPRHLRTWHCLIILWCSTS